MPLEMILFVVRAALLDSFLFDFFPFEDLCDTKRVANTSISTHVCGVTISYCLFLWFCHQRCECIHFYSFYRCPSCHLLICRPFASMVFFHALVCRYHRRRRRCEENHIRIMEMKTECRVLFIGTVRCGDRLFVCWFYENGIFSMEIFLRPLFRSGVVPIASANVAHRIPNSFAWRMCSRWRNNGLANGPPTNNNFVLNEHIFAWPRLPTPDSPLTNNIDPMKFTFTAVPHIPQHETKSKK